MRKQQLYGKTMRVGNEKVKYYLYEKIDGANLGIAKIGDELIICQRNNIIKDFDEIEYKGLKDWIIEHKDALLTLMNDNTIIFGEWVGDNKYNTDVLFYHFASSQLREGTTFDNLCKERIKSLNYIAKEYGFTNDAIYERRASIYDKIPFIKPVPCIVDGRNEPFIQQTYNEIYYEIMNKKSLLNDEVICEGFIMLTHDNKPLKVVYAKNERKKE